MDNFVFKLKEIFGFSGKDNFFHVFREETLNFLNNKNLQMVDYKSVGSLFGMNYIQDNNKNIDILIELNYDFYIIKKFIKELLYFYCERGNLTNKKYKEIIECYAFDTNDLIKVINKNNEKRKFKLLQKKIWIPLNNKIKEQNKKESSNNYELNICNEIDNNSLHNSLQMEIDNTWISINGKKKPLRINLSKYYDNIETEGVSNVENNSVNRFSKLIESDDEDDDSNEEDKRKFGEYEIFNRYDMDDIKRYKKQVDELDKTEKNINKIINNIETEIENKKKVSWADLIDEDC